jgi:hypothetical protein
MEAWGSDISVMNEWRGWFVSVESNRPSGDRATSTIYAARIADPETAISAVRKYAKVTNGKMQILVEASESQLRALKIPDGKVRRIQSAT